MAVSKQHAENNKTVLLYVELWPNNNRLLLTCKGSRTPPPPTLFLFVCVRSWHRLNNGWVSQHREALLTSAATRVMSTLDSANGKQHWVAAKNQARNTRRYHSYYVVISLFRNSNTHCHTYTLGVQSMPYYSMYIYQQDRVDLCEDVIRYCLRGHRVSLDS